MKKFGSLCVVLRHKKKLFQAHIDEKGVICYEHPTADPERVVYEVRYDKYDLFKAKSFLIKRGWTALRRLS